MIALLVVFLLLALIFGIGGALEISLWFLLFIIVAVVLAVMLLKRLVNR